MNNNERVIKTKTVLWFLTGITASVVIFRLFRGLGISTNLTDNNPWGLWIGFDVLSGVALAAGGFTVCAIVYIFHLKEFKALSRPAVLTAFLGYIAVAVGLFFDLGVPWRIWHPMIYWQPGSALFEVGWCVMLYLTVLLLEFSPVVLEKMSFKPFPVILKFLKKFSLLFVILGIGLSFLHQSSLGTLFLLMPERLHPLWYSSIQPLLFFVSAVGLGLAMVTAESLTTSWLYKRPSERNILQKLGKAVPFVLLLYAVLRIGELALNNQLGLVTEGSWESILFIVEISISTILPVILFAFPKTRNNKYGLPIAAALVIVGFIMHRIDVSILSTFAATGNIYFPSFMEITVSVGIVSGSALVFLFFVENFSVYHEEDEAAETEVLPIDVISNGGIFNAGSGTERRFSLFFIIGASLTIFLLPAEGFKGVNPMNTPVKAPLLAAVDTSGSKNVIKNFSMAGMGSYITQTKMLLIDGNRNNNSVLFDHDGHIARNGSKESCGLCHHMNMPKSMATECYKCHSDMFVSKDIFDHELHIKLKDGNQGCKECHTDNSLAKNRSTAKPCTECHETMVQPNSLVKINKSWQGIAAGYMDAQHGLCLDCHEKIEKKRGQKFRTGMSGCRTCHKDAVIQKERTKEIAKSVSKQQVNQ